MNLSDNMTISPSITDNYTATVTMKVKDCFRWEDDTVTADYSVGEFDTTSNLTGTSIEYETLRSFGPGEYSILVE